MEENLPFEVRIVRVEWAGRDNPRGVELAWDPVLIEPRGSGEYHAEIFAYPEVSPSRQGQLAISLQDDAVEPEIVLANGERLPMFPVEHEGKLWWIEKGKWVKSPGYHDAPTCRHVGNLTIDLRDHRLFIDILPPGFSLEEFDLLVGEFKQGLWQLIFDEDSPTTIDVPSTGFGINERFLGAVRDLLHHADKALDAPKEALREVPAVQRLERVKPSPQTFRELAQKGFRRRLTGRGHEHTFNTPENRQLLAILVQMRRVLKELKRVVVARTSEMESQVRFYKEKSEELRTQKKIRVYKHALQEEVKNLEKILQTWNRLCTIPAVQDKCWVFKVEKINRKENSVNCKLIAAYGSEVCEDVNVLLVFQDKQIWEDFSLILFNGEFYEICMQCHEKQNLYSDDIVIVEVNAVYRVSSSLQSKMKNLQKEVRNHLDYLERSGGGFVDRELTEEERKHRREEAMVFDQRAKQLQDWIIDWRRVDDKVVYFSQYLDKLIQKAESFGILPDDKVRVIGSMVFLQNPDYRGALAAYRRALEVINLDTSMIDSLISLDKIGVVDLPLVYERWCLLKIIEALMNRCNMQPEEGFARKLISRFAQQNNVQSELQLSFESPQLKCGLELKYQHKFDSGRTPDFVLQLNPHIKGFEQPLQLVLDAKCKPFAPIWGDGKFRVGKELDELIQLKGYDEGDKNRVFILHPGPNKTASQEWESYCHYGGDSFPWNGEDLPPWTERGNHMFGAVLVRPGCTDHLIRLLNMHIYLSVDFKLVKRGKVRLFCPACGSSNIKEPPDEDASQHKAHWAKKRKAPWAKVCSDCGQLIVRNHCWFCRDISLWKLGLYWNFHTHHVYDCYNIKCPVCGRFFNYL